MGGVMKAITKLFIQFALALIDVPFDRIDRGKISAISVQLTGLIPQAKLAMYSQTKTTATQPATSCFSHSWEHVATMTPTTSWQMNIPALDARARGLRPTLSSSMIAGTVTATLITPVIPVARRLVVALVRPKLWKIIGA